MFNPNLYAIWLVINPTATFILLLTSNPHMHLSFCQKTLHCLVIFRNNYSKRPIRHVYFLTKAPMEASPPPDIPLHFPDGDVILCSSDGVDFRVHILILSLLNLNTSGVSRVQSALLSAPFGWSACLDRVSGLPICLPGLWVRTKLNLERYRDHCAWQQFSLWASQK